MQTKKDILFSIIIPVYNTEKYLEKCLDSVYKAIDVDCEVILINDGSTDKSENVIKNYIKKLSEEFKDNTVYIKKDNKGLADTKNVGIKKARGKYISVVDSDDTITEDFYTTARKYIPENDVIIYDLYVEHDDSEKNYISRAIDETKQGFINKILNGAMLGSSCNKIIKKDLYKYEFPVGKEYEDVAVTPFILIDAKKIKYIPHPNYNYLQRNTSIVGKNTFDIAFFKIVRNISDVIEKIENKQNYNEIINILFIDNIIDNFDYYLRTKNRTFKKYLSEFIEKGKFIIDYSIKNNVYLTHKNTITNRKYVLIMSILNNLNNNKISKIKLMLRTRQIINYFRRIGGSFINFLKTIIGGI